MGVKVTIAYMDGPGNEVRWYTMLYLLYAAYKSYMVAARVAI